MEEHEHMNSVKVPECNDLTTEMKNSCENDCSCSGSKGSCSVSMPICFLVKEQAKSQVAIQDLQKRVDKIESVNEDVVATLIDIRNFLANDSGSLTNLSFTPSAVNLSKSVSKSHLSPYNLSPAIFNLALTPNEVPAGIKLPTNKSGAEQPQKLLDLAKSKESALESDKQDSGLDSDCREQNDAHFSLTRHLSHSSKKESGDELLQLLDEINVRSEVLQKQLAAVDEGSIHEDEKQKAENSSFSSSQPHMNSMSGNKDTLKSKMLFLKTSNRNIASESRSFHLCNTIVENQGNVDDVPIIAKHNLTIGSPEYFMRKTLDEDSKLRKSSKIDSAMVSSVLKETNAVELQRQVLVHLVETAVLQTKLKETEHMLLSKTVECEKIENGLKDEARLLMMENRELRINLDEQKLEVNALKSKVAMLERVLQSVTAENKELTCHLGESLGLQAFSKKEPTKFSSSYTFGNSGVSNRRSSLPPPFASKADSALKSRLSNTNRCLTEDSVQFLPRPQTASAFRFADGPMQSSTPMLSFKQRKSNAASSVPSPVNFQSVKKCLLSSNLDKESQTLKRKSDKCLEETSGSSNLNETFKTLKLPSEDRDNKFPFNIILEKLKANSEYRLSKNSLSKSDAGNKPYDTDISVAVKSKTSFHDPENSHNETKPQGTNSDNAEENGELSSSGQERKGKNIHQRIQDILDRIMAESEEAT